ncbi:MAG: zf-HC2 domain-containing protein, partial [Planctomycetales bacterium]|nr:zf-HC2 domain-containing protein [Planctomycetales bacterium]
MKPFDEELISAYIDNELSEDERREVERWLAESAE